MHHVSVVRSAGQHGVLLCVQTSSGHLAPYALQLPGPLFKGICRSAVALLQQAMAPERLARARQWVPKALLIGDAPDWCEFFAVDFAICEAAGTLSHRLIELQAFPSLYAWAHSQEAALSCAAFGLAPLSERRRALGQIVLGQAASADAVVMLDEAPLTQATGFCFELMARQYGISPQPLSNIVRRGNRLFYHSPKAGGTLQPIERIYNRLIVTSPEQAAHCRELFLGAEVSFAGHPDWYYLLAKSMLPLLDDPSVLPCRMLHLPGDTIAPQQVIKPLFGYGGAGVVLNPALTPADDLPRGPVLAQQRVEYAPCVYLAPEDLSLRLEVRALCLWPKGAPGPQISGLMGRTSVEGMVSATRQRHPLAGACLVAGPAAIGWGE